MISASFLFIFTFLKFGFDVDSLGIPDGHCLYKGLQSFDLLATKEPMSLEFFHRKNTRAHLSFEFKGFTLSNLELDMDPSEVYEKDRRYYESDHPNNFGGVSSRYNTFRPPFDERETGWHRLYISILSDEASYRGVTVTIKDDKSRIWNRMYLRKPKASRSQFFVDVYGDTFMNCSLGERFFEITSTGVAIIPLPFGSDTIPRSVIWFSPQNSTEDERRVYASINVRIGSRNFEVSATQNEKILQLSELENSEDFGETKEFSLSTDYKFNSWSHVQNGALANEVENESQQCYIILINFRIRINGTKPFPKLYIKTAAVWSLEHQPLVSSVSACAPTESIFTPLDSDCNDKDNDNLIWKITCAVSVALLVIQTCIICCISIRRRMKKTQLEPPIYLDSVGPTVANNENDEDTLYDDWDPADFRQGWRKFFKC